MIKIAIIPLAQLLFLLLQLARILGSKSKSSSHTDHTVYPYFGDNNFSKIVVLEIFEKVIAADCTKRPSVVVNGSSPGPPLHFKANTNVKIIVKNLLKDQNTTIHFHGISQYGSPFSDGTQKISQTAIAPGDSYTYVFNLDQDSAGTYIYHAHAANQIVTCYGALIVHEVHPPPFKYDEELTMLFSDYYHNADRQIVEGLEAAPFKWLGEPQALLVNGNALGTCYSNSTYGCDTRCHHHELKVKPNKTYRVRVIGITALSYVYFGIEGHDQLSVIEVDGSYVRPVSTNHMQIHSGQRYSFLLKTKSIAELKKLGSKTEFWGRLETRWRPLRDRGAFVLRYSNTGLSTPGKKQAYSRLALPDPSTFSNLVSLPDEGEAWLTEKFEPLDSKEVAPKTSQVTRRIVITGQQRKSPDGHINWFVNDQKYIETQPNIPFLVRAYTTGIKPDYEAAKKNNGFDPKLGAYPIKLGETVDFLILNQAGMSGVTEGHPWHFHGQRVYVMAHGTGPFSEDKLAEAQAQYKNTHILRDTEIVLTSKTGASYSNMTVPANTITGWMLLRMKAKTPGAWLFHCHIQPHVTMGMGGVLLIGMEDLPKLPNGILKPPQAVAS